MTTVYVKSIAEMNSENDRWWARVRQSQTVMLSRMADVSHSRSSKEAEKVKYKGTLLSQLVIDRKDEHNVQVISSAPHSLAVETGEPKKRGEVKFEDEPALYEWTVTKLLEKEPLKALYFLKRGFVRVGMRGFPFGYPQGLRFMEKGFIESVAKSNSIISEELHKLDMLGKLT